MTPVETVARQLKSQFGGSVRFDDLPPSTSAFMANPEWWEARGVSFADGDQEMFRDAARSVLGLR